MNITPADVRLVLKYNAETGELTWLRRPDAMFKSPGLARMWNDKFAGRHAFTADNGAGYKTGSIFCKRFKAHQVAWCIYYGEWPPKMIDHINRDRSDNRISNLRLADRRENQRNKRANHNSSSRFKGVSWHSQSQKWRSVIRIDGQFRSLGLYQAEEDAALAYDLAASKLHGDFACPNLKRIPRNERKRD